MKKYNVITFGSSSFDFLVKLQKKDYRTIKDKDFLTQRGICFSIGSKIELEHLETFIGGGGSNTACTFSYQGMKTAYIGKVGDDILGKDIINALKKYKFTSFISKDKGHRTNYSIIFSFTGGMRTIFVSRGASSYLTKDDIPWKKLKTEWFYIAPLALESKDIFVSLIDFAERNNIKVAINPSKEQLALLRAGLMPLLSKVDILILNKEEASYLTRVPFQRENDIMKKLYKITKGIVVVTKGKKGAVVLDREYLYKAPTINAVSLDKTGAGDAFGSAFLSGFIKKNDIKQAIALAMLNATSCIKKFGAKNGLLHKSRNTYPLTIKRYKINEIFR